MNEEEFLKQYMGESGIYEQSRAFGRRKAEEEKKRKEEEEKKKKEAEVVENERDEVEDEEQGVTKWVNKNTGEETYEKPPGV